MKPDEVLKYYKSYHYFGKETGMSPMSLWKWCNKMKYIPLDSQVKLSKLSNGDLKVNVNDAQKRGKDEQE